MLARGTRPVLISGAAWESQSTQRKRPQQQPRSASTRQSAAACAPKMPHLGPCDAHHSHQSPRGLLTCFSAWCRLPPRARPRGSRVQPEACAQPASTRAHTHTDTQHTAEQSMQESGWFLAQDGWYASALGKALTPWVREPAPPLEGAPLPAPGPLARAAEGTDHLGEDPEGSASGHVSQ